MWWVPLLAAALMGIALAVLHVAQRRRQVDAAKAYRGRFVQLVAQLDHVTTTVNRLATQARWVKEPKLLDYYESTLRVLETLLSAVTKVPPFGTDASLLDSAFFLARDCRQRVARTQQAFSDAVRGRDVRLAELYGSQRPVRSTSGCYFCSRPVVLSRFAQVRVRIDGDVREVISCKTCKEELESTRKVKVLYFLKDGKPVHWADMPEYVPSEDYWNINKRAFVHKTPKLELVTHHADAIRPE
jgi:hypothetical protein